MADMVHHIKARDEFPQLALVMENLVSLCNACHNKEHPEKGGGQKKKRVSRKIKVVEMKGNEEI